MDVHVVTDQKEFIFIISEWTQDVVWKNCQERWMIGMYGERGSGKYVLSAHLDDDDDELLLEAIIVYWELLLVTWNHIIISITLEYLKPYNCVQIICIR